MYEVDVFQVGDYVIVEGSANKKMFYQIERCTAKQYVLEHDIRFWIESLRSVGKSGFCYDYIRRPKKEEIKKMRHDDRAITLKYRIQDVTRERWKDTTPQQLDRIASAFHDANLFAK